MDSVQRSFRLSAATCTLLDSLAATSNESRNSLLERLLAEALRTERHPLTGFRQGAAGWPRSRNAAESLITALAAIVGGPPRDWNARIYWL